MQAGVAIVGPSFSEVGQLVKTTGCGMLVDTESAETVAETILRLLDDPDQIEKMATKGRKAFEQRLNWETEQEKLISLFRLTNLVESKQNGS